MSGEDASDRTKLLEEIQKLRLRISDLEKRESDHAAIQRALRKSEEMARAMLNATIDLVYLTDVDWRILALSRRAAERLGKRAEEMIGTNVFDYFPSEVSKRRMERGYEVIRTGQPLSFEDSRDGMHFDISLYPAFDSDGKVDRMAVYVRDITEKKKIEERLSATEGLYRAVVEASPDGILVADLSGKIIAANRQAALLTGYEDATQLVGQNAITLVAPQDADRASGRLAKVLDIEFGKDVQYVMKRRDGSLFNSEINARRLVSPSGEPTAFLVVFTDVSERTKTERALQESEKRLRLMTENSVDFLFMTDSRGRLVYGSDSGGSLFGYSLQERLGGLFTDNIHPDDIPVGREQFRKVLSGEAVKSVELTAIHKNGRQIPIEATAVPIYEDGKVVNVFGIVRDISERKRLEEKIREYTEDLEAMVKDRTRELEETNRALRKEIVDRMRAEEETRQGENRLQSIFRAAPIGIGVVADRVILQVNERVCEICGYSREELIGKSARMLYPTDQDFEFVGREKYDQIRERGTGTVETRWLRKDGIIVDVLLSSTPMDMSDFKKGVTFTALDITDRKKVEQDLEMLAAVVRRSSELINLATPDGKMVFLNEAGAKFLGIKPEDVESTSIRDVIPEHFNRTLETELLPALMNGGKWEGDLQIRDQKTGEIRDVHTLTFTINKQDTGEVMFLANVSRDITDRKRADRERRDIEARLQQAEKLESLGILAGGIAHDFNNLLMGILGNADLALLRLSEASPIRPYVEDILEASQKAADLVRQMLAYSGKGRFVIKTVSLSEIVEEMAHLLQTSIAKDTSLMLNLEKDLPVVEVDITQIQQIIMNMVINANEAIGSKKRGVIGISTGVQECSAEYLSRGCLREALPEGEYVYMEISDNGCGMDRETTARIFDPFFTTKFTGRGLGLSAVLGIVRGHRGELMVESTPGRGTKFKVLFPKVAAGAVAAKRSYVPLNSSEWKGSGTILLVDDERWILSTVELMLQDMGFKVLTAVNGNECLEILESQKDEIGCVLLDLTMPEKNGEEVLAELSEKKMEVPVILSSGYDEQAIMERFQGGQVVGFIQKPYRSAELQKVIKTLFDG